MYSICGYGKPIYNETNPIISEGNDVFISFRSPPFSSIIDFEDTYFQGFQLNFQLSKYSFNNMAFLFNSITINFF